MKTLHVAFGVDEAYLQPMGVALTSILEHNRHNRLVFHIFAPHVPDDARTRLAFLQQQYGQEIRLHAVDQTFLDRFVSIPIPRHISTASYIRLLIPGALHGIADNVLYLDADIVCCGDLSELAAPDPNHSIVAAVTDNQENTFVRRLGLTHGKYFNAGVMYVDIDAWCRHNVSDEVIALRLSDPKNLNYAEQDALNVVLDGKVSFIDNRWNLQYELWRDVQIVSPEMRIPDDSVFIHFVGHVKPWDIGRWHASSQFYIQHHMRSPWRDLTPVRELSSRQMRQMSSALRKQKQYRQSLKWSWRYLMVKLRAMLGRRQNTVSTS